MEWIGSHENIFLKGNTMTPFMSFIAGFGLASIVGFVMMLISFEVRQKRAIAFTKRFAVISEGLSSLKALAFRACVQIKKIRSQFDKADITKQDVKRVAKYLDSIIYIFDHISANMMPPTEEIAMNALSGKKTSAEERAYEDGIKFRNDIRQLRQKLEEEGLEELGKNLVQQTAKARPQMKIVDTVPMREEDEI